MGIKFNSVILLIYIFCYSLFAAFMTVVPFSVDPDIPKITKKLCQDVSGKRLFAYPTAGRALWWRDSQGNIRSAYFVVDKERKSNNPILGGQSEIHFNFSISH